MTTGADQQPTGERLGNAAGPTGQALGMLATTYADDDHEQSPSERRTRDGDRTENDADRHRYSPRLFLTGTVNPGVPVEKVIEVTQSGD